MKAVLFDVYGTLLVGTRVPDREGPLRRVAEEHGLEFPGETSLTETLDHEIARAHRQAVSDHPEVDIREIWKTIFPDLVDPDDFSLDVENAVHPVAPARDVVDTILELQRDGMTLGIVSNAQAYTRHLLRQHLGPAWECLRPDLCIFSYEHRIAKPDPSLFQIALDRLHELGISPSDTLMVGDSQTNDIEPADRLGLQTHRVQPGHLTVSDE